MAAAAFDGDGGGGCRYTMTRRQWKLTSAVAGGDGGHQRLTAAMDKGGRWRLTVAMDGSCGSDADLGGGRGIPPRHGRDR